MNYQQKLLDPRWQKKRLLIFQRDNWSCRNCGATDKTLHIHHEMYSGEPWDISDDKLKTLCETCHIKNHAAVTPDLNELQEIRIQLLDKISNTNNKTHISVWKQAISVIEQISINNYGTDLNHLNPLPGYAK